MYVHAIKLFTMRKISLLLLSFSFLVACNKQAPPTEGLYLGTFSGFGIAEEDTIRITRIVNIQITSSNSKELLFYHSENGDSGIESTVQLDRKNIKGTIKSWTAVSWSDSPTTHISHINKFIDIEGRWEKLGGEYVITGKFKSIYHFVSTAENIDVEYPVEGSFTIKPAED